MRYPTKEQAEEILDPILGRLRRSVEGGFGRWIMEAAPIFPVATKRGRRVILQELVLQQAREIFAGDRDVNIVDGDDNRTCLLYRNIVLRFKHLDRKFRTSNYPTAKALILDSQATLPGYFPGVRLTLGWQLDDFETALQGVHVVCFVERRKPAWDFQIGAVDGQQVLHYPQAAEPEKESRPTSRVRGKQQKETGKVVRFNRDKKPRQ